MEAYFDGKPIKIIVGFSPGGGYDAFGRLFGKFAPRHFPGTPKFIVMNVPGSGGERVWKAIDGETDGYSVAVSHPRFYKRELLGTDVEYFDPTTVNILGTPDASAVTTGYYVFRDFATSWEEALATGETMTAGNTAIGDTGGVGVAFAEALGAPMKQISGYGGTSEIAAAFDRREITGTSRGNYTSAISLFPEWIEEKAIVPLFTWGADPADDPAFVDYVTKDLNAKVPPHIYDALAAAGITVTDGQKAVFSLTETVNDSLSRTFVLPAGVPQDVVDVWVKGFADTIGDPDFVAAAGLLGRPVHYGGPESIIEALALGKTALSDPENAKLFGLLAGAE
jgi:tripartite-type tricarboxylate transporter receptor subunit TctC